MGNRLFAISHKDVYALFKAWGWVDGPSRSDGHYTMEWPKTGQRVQIMPPSRPGTGEKGNAIAMKQARKIMELDSVQRFLDGPVKEKAEQPHQPPLEVINKEEPIMARVAENSVVGIRKVLASILMERPNHNFHIDDVVLLAREVDPRIDYTKVGGNLSQMSKDNGWPDIYKTGRGFYAYKPQVAAAPVEEKPIPNEPEPAPPVETYVEPVDVRPDIPTPAPVSLNGSTPDLLSKVHVLDGGRYLFQGDDGGLYVIKDLVRLEV